MTNPSLVSSDEEDHGAEVIDLAAVRQASTVRAQESTEKTAGVEYASAQRMLRSRRRQENPVDKALRQLSAAQDRSLSGIERENAFDAWRDILDDLASGSFSRSVEYREVLGLVLAAVHRLDLSDLSKQQLEVFRDATVRLNAPRLVTIDVTWVREALHSAGARTVLPLSTDGLSAAAVTELEQLITEIEHGAD